MFSLFRHFTNKKWTICKTVKHFQNKSTISKRYKTVLPNLKQYALLLDNCLLKVRQSSKTDKQMQISKSNFLNLKQYVFSIWFEILLHILLNHIKSHFFNVKYHSWTTLITPIIAVSSLRGKWRYTETF